MIKNQVINVQDQFLNRIRRDRKHVVVGLINGGKLEGIIHSFDNFCLVLRGEADQLIYKHAISTISPGEKLDYFEPK